MLRHWKPHRTGDKIKRNLTLPDGFSVNACVIANPAAGRGRTRRLLREIRNSFDKIGITDFQVTTGAGDEEALALRSLDRGVGTIAVVGGDGTCSRVADTILRTRADCRLAVVATGTGNDFAKTLGVRGYAPAEVAALCAEPSSTRIDVGRADGIYFLNSCGFGFDASVIEASEKVRWLKGDAVYMYSALAQLLTYRGVDVSIDGVAAGGKMLMITVSNGRSFGGAFRIAPRASVVDSELDAGFFRDCSILDRVRLFAAAIRGTHEKFSSVKTRRVRQLSLSFGSTPSMEMDGELRHATSKTVLVECAASSLSVVAAPGALL